MRSAALLFVLAAGGCALARPAYVPDAATIPSRSAPEAGPAAPSGRERARGLLAGPRVTMDDVLRAVELASPEIEAAYDDVLAATGRAWQAGLHPNPTLEFERTGSADRQPWDRSEFLVGIRQPIVLSDRRRQAVSLGLAEREARALAVRDVRRQVRGIARIAFLELVYHREAAALHRELLGIAQRTLDVARERLEAGVAVASEALKSELEVASLRSALAGFDRRREASRARLEVLLGGIPVPVDRLAPGGAPRLDDREAVLREAIRGNPSIQVARQEVEVARQRLALARSASRPDITARVAAGRDLQGDDFVAEFGVEFPLAVFDAGQGSVFEAEALVSKARRDVESVERAVAAELSRSFGEAEAALAQLEDLRERVLPLAQRALETTRDEHANGRREFLDVLDAQRTLLEVRATMLAFERDAALADAEIVALKGDAP